MSGIKYIEAEQGGALAGSGEGPGAGVAFLVLLAGFQSCTRLISDLGYAQFGDQPFEEWMPRKIRLHVPGALYHVMLRGGTIMRRDYC